MVSSIGDPAATGRGRLLFLPEIIERTRFADGTIRSKYHGGTMACVWKLGRRLVVWEADLAAWLLQEQNRTTKHRQMAPGGTYEAMVSEAPDLAALAALVKRERAIRDTMAATGEDRQTVVDMMAAFQSMGQEAVLDLTEGGPTTMRSALQTYVDALDEAEERAQVGVDGVINHLETLLGYPWPGADSLEIDRQDECVVISVNGRELFTANHDEHGSAGMDAAERVAQAVYDAVAK